MSVQRRVSVSTTRLVLAAVAAGSLATLALTGPAPPAEALTGPSPGTYAGPGFDTCEAPASDVMGTWLVSSPYRAVGIYIGGNNRGCPTQANLTSSWVNTQRTAGWHLLPIYMGTQPYCSDSAKIHRFNGANAAQTGRDEAGDAVVRARALGLAAGSTIFSDIEAYSTTGQDNITHVACTPAVTTAVLTYQSAWTSRLHELGFVSGFYSSLGSGVRDQVAAYGSTAYLRPDYLWFARYDNNPTVSDPAIPSTYWLHRRVKQYRGGATETYGGKTLNVDRNVVDVTAVPSTPFGDFNGNGWPDVLVRQASTGSLYLYPGNGGTLTGRTRLGGGWNVMGSITRLGDFNRDGHEDVIARETTTGVLWLYLGNGTGFSSRVRLGGGWNAMREITPVGDFTGDGYPDLLAVRSSTGSLYLYPGHGTSVAAGRRLGAGWNAMTELVGVGDVNRDGRVDLMARHSATGVLWLYPGTGTGLGARVQKGAGWDSMRDLVGVGDFDRDGSKDVLAVETATGRLFRYPTGGTSLGPRIQVGSGWTSDLRPLL
jgi:hypothetical protein